MKTYYFSGLCFRRFFCLITAFILAACAGAQEEPERSIVEIGEDLYRAQNGGHYTVFLVTDEGIILSESSFICGLGSNLSFSISVVISRISSDSNHFGASLR